jgi:hypothetical protein
MARRPVMNESKKLELSKETLRCLDDQDLTGVAGGWGEGGGGGHNNNNSFGCSVVCVSYECQSVGICDSGICLVL